MKNREKIVAMLDEMIEMLPEPKYLMDPEGGPKTYKHQDWLTLSLNSLRDLIDNASKHGGKNENLERISELYPELVKDQAFVILNDMFSYGERQDAAHKAKMLAENNAEKTIGKSWLLFNLDIIKGLLEEDE